MVWLKLKTAFAGTLSCVSGFSAFSRKILWSWTPRKLRRYRNENQSRIICKEICDFCFQQRYKFEKDFADYIIRDGLKFLACQIKNWEWSLKLLFGFSSYITYCEKISSTVLHTSFESVDFECKIDFRDATAIFFSIDGVFWLKALGYIS